MRVIITHELSVEKARSYIYQDTVPEVPGMNMGVLK